jgi:hypothetical protein
MTTPDYDWTAGVEAMMQQEWAKAEPVRTPEEMEEVQRELRQLLVDNIPADPPPKPVLVASNPDPQPPPLLPISVDRPDIALVVDNDATNALARELEENARVAAKRVREVLDNPPEKGDPLYPQWLQFLSSTYSSSMTTLVRVDENKLRRQEISRLPELLAKVAEQERLRDARRTIEIKPGEDPSAA